MESRSYQHIQGKFSYRRGRQRKEWEMEGWEKHDNEDGWEGYSPPRPARVAKKGISRGGEVRLTHQQELSAAWATPTSEVYLVSRRRRGTAVTYRASSDL